MTAPTRVLDALQHRPKLVQSHHHSGIGFNARLATIVTNNVGTVWCAYLFAVIGITSLIGAFTGNVALTLIAGGFSSYFLQLVLLPLIMVGQNIAQKASDARAEADHATLTALKILNDHQLEELNLIKEVLNNGTTKGTSQG